MTPYCLIMRVPSQKWEGTRGRKADERAVSFAEKEAEYLAENFIGRLATSSTSSQPHVVPVAYSFDGKDIYFSGYNLAHSLKYRHIKANNRVAFVVDDLVSTKPWKARGVEVRGIAETVETEGGITVKIKPTRVVSWGLENS